MNNKEYIEEQNCEHKNRAYSSMGMTLTVNPPINISYWICKDCGFEGEDRNQQPDLDAEYREAKQKFGKGGTTTFTNL